MKSCIFYLSRTGNTKLFANAISIKFGAHLFDITAPNLVIRPDFDLVFVGTPVNGFKPAKEVTAFVETLPDGQGKKTIVFCTYALMQGSALKVLQKQLTEKGYQTVLAVSKRIIRKDSADFSDCLAEIKKVFDQ